MKFNKNVHVVVCMMKKFLKRKPENVHISVRTSQVLIASGLVVFIEDLPFSPYLVIDCAQNE